MLERMYKVRISRYEEKGLRLLLLREDGVTLNKEERIFTSIYAPISEPVREMMASAISGGATAVTIMVDKDIEDVIYKDKSLPKSAFLNFD